MSGQSYYTNMLMGYNRYIEYFFISNTMIIKQNMSWPWVKISRQLIFN